LSASSSDATVKYGTQLAGIDMSGRMPAFSRSPPLNDR
jgi:hypothetical protein